MSDKLKLVRTALYICKAEPITEKHCAGLTHIYSRTQVYSCLRMCSAPETSRTFFSFSFSA